MSLFKPSNLTPNFESVVYNQPLTLTFQVNSNGSKGTAYRVQILTDFNDKDDPDKNIIGTVVDHIIGFQRIGIRLGSLFLIIVYTVIAYVSCDRNHECKCSDNQLVFVKNLLQFASS